MLTTIIASAIVLNVIGAVVMVAKMRRAPEGFEDAEGFHLSEVESPSILAPVAVSTDHKATQLLTWGAEPHRLAS